MFRAVRLVALAWTLAGIAVVGLVAVLLLRPAVIVGVDGNALRSSIAAEVSGVSSDAPPCRELPARWRCRLSAVGRNRLIPYRVEVSEDGCWIAVRTEGKQRERAAGCIGPFDYLRIFD